ncbi:MAG: AAA family ATPase [Ardenticatenaceae bacterium]|nr:AAA family ATPase [Ardenticatenaceae bacterium]
MTLHEAEQIRRAIAALETQRAVLGDAVVDTALAPLREKLAALAVPPPLAAPPVDERKWLTILFADVCGYTELSETRDPEDVTAIMNRLFEMLTAEITRYGGSVDKYSGDAVMALFGAPQALESHEVMAVRAALAIQAGLATFSAEIEREWGLSLQMRIGINTGEVVAGLVGGRGAKSYTVMGDTVNLAARLEHACPAGRVMVSAATARALPAIFDLEPPQQITVKGKVEPVTVCLVIGPKTEPGRVRGLAGFCAPMVGRDAELATLRVAFEGACADSRWRVAAVIGDAGIGKTRLRREFLAWVTQVHPETHLLTARSYVHTQATPYYLVAGLMRALFRIGEDVDAATATGRLASGLRALDPLLDETEFRYRLGSVARVLGLPLPDDPLQSLGPEQRRDRTFLSLERILLTAAELAPRLIVIEDLHWADALSVAFIERFLQVATRDPIREHGALLLALSRPREPRLPRGVRAGADGPAPSLHRGPLAPGQSPGEHARHGTARSKHPARPAHPGCRSRPGQPVFRRRDPALLSRGPCAGSRSGARGLVCHPGCGRRAGPGDSAGRAGSSPGPAASQGQSDPAARSDHRAHLLAAAPGRDRRRRAQASVDGRCRDGAFGA